MKPRAKALKTFVTRKGIKIDARTAVLTVIFYVYPLVPKIAKETLKVFRGRMPFLTQ